MSSSTEIASMILDRLGSVPNLAVFDGQVGAVTKDNGVARPYAVLYLYPANLTRTRYVDRSDLVKVMFQVTVAAGTVAGCRWATDRVVDVLTDHRLEPANRTAAPITMVSEIAREVEDRSDPEDIRWFSAPLFRTTTNRS